MALLRPEIESIEQNGITRTALPRIGDPDLIPLWFGEGDIVTPDFIRDAAKRSLDDGETFYCHTRGRQDLRDAIKAYLDRLYGIDLDPDRITVPGSTMLGVCMSAQMALSRGSRGLVVSPNWPNIDINFRVTGAEVDYVRKHIAAGRWALDLDELAAAIRPETRAIYINSPCNPTGWIMPREQQEALLTMCRERDILLLADEVYHRNVYDGDHAPSFLEIASDDDPLVVVNGFSKAWAMTGWRLGWMVAPSRYATHLAVLSECFNTGATVFTQPGGIAALEQGEDWIRTLRERFRRGREIVVSAFAGHPNIELIEPEGAFYAFVRVAGMASSERLAEGLRDEEDVGIAPGGTFGPGNDEYFRLCFAQSHARLEEALGRIVRYIDRNHNRLCGRD